MYKYPSFMALLLALGLSEITAYSATAAEVPGNNKKKVLKDDSNRDDTDKDLPPPLTAVEKKAICRDYNGKYISYYDRVYHVIDCQRYELSPRQTYELTRKSKPPVEVSARVIDGLGYAGFEKARKKTPLPLCKRYHHQYITSEYVDVYWVKGCVKHPFPDWSSYEVHAGKLRHDRPALKAIDRDDFHMLSTGTPMKSIIDEEFREILEDEAEQADILPLDEACKGLIGSHVTYLGHIFYISKVPGKKGSGDFCERRAVDSEKFTRKMGMKGFRLHELNSSQALSIPTGSPMPETGKPG